MKTTTKEVIYKGIIVHCTDLDSLDEYHIELNLNEVLFEEGNEDKLQRTINNSAMKNELISLSGNSFDFENAGFTGRVLKVTTIREEISPMDKDVAELLEQIPYKHG